jgi:hypothetical protein
MVPIGFECLESVSGESLICMANIYSESVVSLNKCISPSCSDFLAS